MDIGILILRLVVGGLMFGHGTQKLFGWFGGHGVEGTRGFFGSLGYPAAGAMAGVAGAAEAGGGALLALGFLTPLAAAAIAGVLFNAIVVAHWPKVWNTEGGLEHPLTVATAALTVAFTGPGRFSVDALLGWDLSGTAWGFGALGLALFAALVILIIRALARSVATTEEPAEGEERKAA